MLAISADALGLLLRYAFWLTVIFLGLLLIGIVKRKDKKNLTVEALKNAVERSKNFAERQLNKKGKLAYSARLMKLSSAVSSAEWLALRIVEEKKEIAFEGISKELDRLATDISARASDSFIHKTEFEACLQNSLQRIGQALETINALLVKTA